MAGILAVAIFAIDTYFPLGIAVAVLYILVILLSANFLPRGGTIAVAAGCGVLAVAGYVLQHGLFSFEAPLARLAMSLSAIAITAFLAVRNQTARLHLQMAERELRATLDTIPALVIRTRPDGTVDFMNARWKAQGFNETEVLADWLALVHPDDRAAMAQARARSIASGESYEAELRMRRADGAYRWLSSRAVAVHDEQGRVTARYVAATDIEDRKHAEAALHQTQAELAHVARVTTLGEFTASIAHEVNQPLAAIVTNGEVCLRLLEMEPLDKAELRDATREIIGNGRRASQIIARVRELSRKSEPNWTPLDLNEVVEEVLPLLRGEALKHRLSLRLALAPGLAPVRGDRVALQQVLINLIVNGMEAMNAGPDEEREVVVRTGRNDDGAALVEVVDRGAGLGGGDANRMFDAFFTTKAHGMGMGLAICRSIVESHGGRIWASSNAGPGATVQFALPPHGEQT